ncbi:UNVERIFIED_CONTAM: hypothetical protein GTU68_055996, partial [Idotea baltica]|nr:hypothetical protein [Idotea baltica]
HNSVGIPALCWYGIENNYRALITDVYGPSLKQLMQFCGGKFTLKTTLLVVDQLIDRINWVHQKKFIYNDIDPENFLVGLREQADKIFMVDFGSCKKYLDENDNHIVFGK